MPYTTRSWDPNGNGSGKGIGFEKGLKVVTNPVDGVAAGQVLWFSNASVRDFNGNTYVSYPPGTLGNYWTSTPRTIGSTSYLWAFYSGVTSRITSENNLWGLPVRCVR